MTSMTESPPKASTGRNVVLDTLAANFPVFRDCQPLAIGIHKVLKLRQPDLSDGGLRLALRLHTASTKYLKAIANGSQRFDLDGNATGEITAEQRQQALDTLKERFRKGAEKQRAAQLEQQRQDKLRQLAEKFAKH